MKRRVFPAILLALVLTLMLSAAAQALGEKPEKTNRTSLGFLPGTFCFVVVPVHIAVQVSPQFLRQFRDAPGGVRRRRL